MSHNILNVESANSFGENFVFIDAEPDISPPHVETPAVDGLNIGTEYPDLGLEGAPTGPDLAPPLGQEGSSPMKGPNGDGATDGVGGVAGVPGPDLPGDLSPGEMGHNGLATPGFAGLGEGASFGTDVDGTPDPEGPRAGEGVIDGFAGQPDGPTGPNLDEPTTPGFDGFDGAPPTTGFESGEMDTPDIPDVPPMDEGELELAAMESGNKDIGANAQVDDGTGPNTIFEDPNSSSSDDATGAPLPVFRGTQHNPYDVNNPAEKAEWQKNGGWIKGGGTLVELTPAAAAGAAGDRASEQVSGHHNGQYTTVVRIYNKKTEQPTPGGGDDMENPFEYDGFDTFDFESAAESFAGQSDPLLNIWGDDGVEGDRPPGQSDIDVIEGLGDPITMKPLEDATVPTTLPSELPFDPLDPLINPGNPADDLLA
ncbi:MAG: hypothetical protein AAF318_18925 [Pseudomonadota bacterium]